VDSVIRDAEVHLRYSQIGQSAGLVQLQGSIYIRQHRLVVQSQFTLVPAVRLGDRLAGLLPGTTAEQDHHPTQHRRKRKNTQGQASPSRSPNFYSRYAFHRFPFFFKW